MKTKTIKYRTENYKADRIYTRSGVDIFQIDHTMENKKNPKRNGQVILFKKQYPKAPSTDLYSSFWEQIGKEFKSVKDAKKFIQLRKFI